MEYNSETRRLVVQTETVEQKPQKLNVVFEKPEPQPPQMLNLVFEAAEWPRRTEKQERPQPPEPERMTRRDFLQTWGFLQTLKDELEAKARAAASGGAELGPQVAGDYLKMCAEISAMQEKIDREAAARE